MEIEEIGLISNEQTGFITNWQDYSVHDGYGIRLIVFYKGCPLRCKWCQNPENVDSFFEVEYHSSLCQSCGRCSEVCPVKGAIIEDKERRIDRDKCTRCMSCCETCPSKALARVGQWMTVGEVVNRIIRYQPFYRSSGEGGVTLSGGEPLFQPEFTLKLLKSCREFGVHTAIETCGLAGYEKFKSIAINCDLILYDIKHMNDGSHKRGTGQSNSQILENLARFRNESDIECVVRIPLIPGFNDDEENITETAKFLKSLKRVPRVDLLPFNELASSKYRVMGLEYDYWETRRQPEEIIKRLKEIVESYGIEVTTEGLW
jgi:pyruvate formate lyase activating enzyme